MAIGPVVEVPAPVGAEARRYSILDSAVGPLDLPNNRPSDLAYKQVSCGPVSAYSYDCESTTTTPSSPGMTSGPAFDVEVGIECHTVGMQYQEIRTMIERAFAAREHIGVEGFLATQLLADSTNLGTATDVVEAIATLESFIYASEFYGFKAYILAPFALSAYFADRSAYAGQGKRDPVWRTPTGSIVTFIWGLPQDTIIATGQITLWRQPEVWIPDEAALVQRENNTWVGRGRRGYAATWECLSARITVTESI